MIKCPLSNGCHTFYKRNCNGDGTVKRKGKERRIQGTKCITYVISLNPAKISKTDTINMWEFENKNETTYN